MGMVEKQLCDVVETVVETATGPAVTEARRMVKLVRGWFPSMTEERMCCQKSSRNALGLC